MDNIPCSRKAIMFSVLNPKNRIVSCILYESR